MWRLVHSVELETSRPVPIGFMEMWWGERGRPCYKSLVWVRERAASRRGLELPAGRCAPHISGSTRRHSQRSHEWGRCLSAGRKPRAFIIAAALNSGLLLGYHTCAAQAADIRDAQAQCWMNSLLNAALCPTSGTLDSFLFDFSCLHRVMKCDVAWLNERRKGWIVIMCLSKNFAFK